MDGYNTFEVSNKELASFNEERCLLDSKINEIILEIDKLPAQPSSMEDWISSWHEPNKKTFGLDTFKKRFKINREFNKILESSETNLRNIKIVKIEDLLSKIDKLLQSE